MQDKMHFIYFGGLFHNNICVLEDDSTTGKKAVEKPGHIQWKKSEMQLFHEIVN